MEFLEETISSMSVSLRSWIVKLGLLLLAFSVVSLVLVARGAMQSASPVWFISILIGATGIPAALGVGFIVNNQPLSVNAKRKIIAAAIVLAAITGFGLMFWMIGNAYSQVSPR